MRWAELVLSYVQTIIWPATVVGVGWFFRRPIRDRLQDLLELEALGVKTKFADRRLESEIAENARTLGATTPVKEELPPADSNSPVVEGSGTASATLSAHGSGTVDDRRDALQDLVQATATWAADRQRAGLTVDGVRIEWDDDGHPSLRTPPRPFRFRSWGLMDSFNSAARDRARDLEGRIDLRVRNIAKLKAGQADAGLINHHEQRLKDLKDELAMIDPDSPQAK